MPKLRRSFVGQNRRGPRPSHDPSHAQNAQERFRRWFKCFGKYGDPCKLGKDLAIMSMGGR